MTVTSPNDSNVPWQLIFLQCSMWCFTSVLQRQNPRLVQDSMVNNSRTERDRTIKTVSCDSWIFGLCYTVEKTEGATPWTPLIETARQAVVRARQEIKGGHFYFRAPRTRSTELIRKRYQVSSTDLYPWRYGGYLLSRTSVAADEPLPASHRRLLLVGRQLLMFRETTTADTFECILGITWDVDD